MIIGFIEESSLRLILFSWGAVGCLLACVTGFIYGELPLNDIVLDKESSPRLFLLTCLTYLLMCFGLVFLSIYAT